MSFVCDDAAVYEALLDRAESVDGKMIAERLGEAGTFEVPSGYANYVYIDPSAATSGNGASPATPRNTWPLRLASNTAFLQKAGTEAINVRVLGAANNASLQNVYVGAYGNGLRPVLHGTDTGTKDHAIIHLPNVSGGIVENLDLRVYNGQRAFILQPSSGDVDDVTIQRCKMHVENNPEVNNAFAYCISAWSNAGVYTFKNITIKQNEFTGVDKRSMEEGWGSGLRLVGIYMGFSAPTPQNINICENYFHDSPLMGIRLYDATGGVTDLPESRLAKGVRIENNIFHNLAAEGALMTGSGILSTEDFPSCINGNIFKNIGGWSIPNVNALQCQWLVNVEIAYNYVDTVMTNAPDGAGIIIDWSARKLSRLSDNCRVHHNICRNCYAREVLDGAMGGAGISLYACKNTWAYSNYSFDNSVGVSCSNIEEKDVARCTGNKVFNNTLCYNRMGIRVRNMFDIKVANNAMMYNTWGITSNKAYNTQGYDCKGNAFFDNYAAHRQAGASWPADLSDGNVDYASTVGSQVSALRQSAPEKHFTAWMLDSDSPLITTGGVVIPEYSDPSVSTEGFGLNGNDLASLPSVGCFQGQVAV